MPLILASLGAFLLSLILTPLVRAAAHRLGMVAAPRADRWHQRPTAMLGGIAMYAAFVAGYALFAPTLPSASPILLAASLLFLTGLVDDCLHLKPYMKLIFQLVAAAVTVYAGLSLPWTGSAAVNNLLTLFWLVGITNAVNVLDNMDGLAGGVSVIACLFLMLTFLLNGQVAEATLPALLGGAVLGFLVYNLHPASIFMGDCGSLFLGFVLGGTALLSEYGRSRNLIAVLFTPVLIMLIPIFDISVVTVTRKLSGRRASQGGRDHTSHRLVTLGMSEPRAVFLLYALAAFSGLLALLVRVLEAEMALLLVPGFALMLLFLGIYLGMARVDGEAEPHPAGRTILTALAEFSYKRRMFEVLLDVVLVVLAYYGAYVLRWDGDLPPQQVAILVRTLPLMVAMELLCFLVCGLYRGLWRYVGIDDLVVLGKSVLAGSVVSAGVIFAMYGLRGPSRAVFILNALLLFFFVGGSRVSFRLLRALIVGRGLLHPAAKPVLIYGAGDGGDLLIREILNNPDLGYVPVGFIDDDQLKVGKLMHGCRIFNLHQLPDLIRTHGVREVLVSSLKVADSRLADLRLLGVSLRRMRVRIE